MLNGFELLCFASLQLHWSFESLLLHQLSSSASTRSIVSYSFIRNSFGTDNCFHHRLVGSRFRSVRFSIQENSRHGFIALKPKSRYQVKAVYKANGAAMFVTVGPSAGVVQLFGIVLWSFLVVKAKSKELLIPLFVSSYTKMA